MILIIRSGSFAWKIFRISQMRTSISKESGIDFVLSVSAELEEMIGVVFEGVEVLN